MTLFEFLAEPGNHRLLTSRRVRLLELCETGSREISGMVLIRGPLGARRRAGICTTTWEPASFIGGTARVGRHTTVDVCWHLLSTIESRTKVALRATIVEAGPLDRLLLQLGGAEWLRRLFDETLTLLAARMEAPHTEAPRMGSPRTEVPRTEAFQGL
jgi:hypothetical protein